MQLLARGGLDASCALQTVKFAPLSFLSCSQMRLVVLVLKWQGKALVLGLKAFVIIFRSSGMTRSYGIAPWKK